MILYKVAKEKPVELGQNRELGSDLVFSAEGVHIEAPWSCKTHKLKYSGTWETPHQLCVLLWSSWHF